MFFILLILILLIAIILNSKIQIRIKNLDISTERKTKTEKSFEIYLEIIIFNKFKILKVNLKNLKNKKIDFNTALEKAKQINKNIQKEKIIKDALENIKNVKFEIIKAEFKLELGTKDAALTAIAVGIVASILGIILKNQKFEILPIYQDKNILNLNLNCIFRINLIHYIYITILKGRDKNERKSSNRRSYAYSNE